MCKITVKSSTQFFHCMQEYYQHLHKCLLKKMKFHANRQTGNMRLMSEADWGFIDWTDKVTYVFHFIFIKVLILFTVISVRCIKFADPQKGKVINSELAGVYSTVSHSLRGRLLSDE